MEGEPRLVGSDRQRDSAGTAAENKGKIGGRGVAKYMRRLGEGGVGVGRSAAASEAEQVASECAGKRGGGGDMGKG